MEYLARCNKINIIISSQGGGEMVTYKRHICFHYYKVVLEEDRNGEWVNVGDFNIADWLADIEDNHLLKQEVALSDCMACIEKIELEQNEDIYSMRFHKLRDTNIPSKFKRGQDAETIPLEDDEYIAEEMNILYDRRIGVCMVQQNRMSLGTARIAEWMAKEYGKQYRVNFLPISNYEPTQRFRGKQIRAIDVTFANMEQQNGNIAFSDLLDGVRPLRACTGHLILSVGHSRSKELDNVASIDLIEQLRGHTDIVSGARVKIRDDDKGRIELVDLFDEVLHDFIEFEIESKVGLDFATEKYQMLRQYHVRLREIEQHLGIEVEE